MNHTQTHKIHKVLIHVITQKRPYLSYDSGHIYLVHFASIKVVKMRKSINHGSRKKKERKLNPNEKRQFHRVGAAGES